MTKAATADRNSPAGEWQLLPLSEEDSQIRIQAIEPPPASEVDAPRDEPVDETDSDFIHFLCGRFDLDRERGAALLSTLLEGYVATEAYPIHTLAYRGEPDDEDLAG